MSFMTVWSLSIVFFLFAHQIAAFAFNPAIKLPSSSFTHAQYFAPHELDLHESGRGVVTRVDRSPGDVLLRVPLADTISVDTLKIQDQDFDEVIIPAKSQEGQLALALLHLANTMEHPYASEVLSRKHASIWSMPANLWMSDCMKAIPRCYRETLQASRMAAMKFIQVSFDAENTRGVPEHQGSTMDDCLAAFALSRSRSTAIPELAKSTTHSADDKVTDSGDTLVPIGLIPGIDLFNYQLGTGTALELLDGHWILKSNQQYKAGDEIFLALDEGGAGDHMKRFLSHGLPLVEYKTGDCSLFRDVVSHFTWEDLLDAAGVIRPEIFKEDVRQGLHGHPQLRHFVAPAENRSTFSLDSRTQQPRTSLLLGLKTLSSVVSQLKHPNDDALSGDILTQLVETRKADLSNCLKHFDSMQLDSDDEEWSDYMNGLQGLLSVELSNLEGSGTRT